MTGGQLLLEASNLIVKGNLTMSAGTITHNNTYGAGTTLEVQGNLSNTGGTYTAANGSVLKMSNLAAPTDATITGAWSPYNFYLSKTGKTLTLNGALTVNSSGTTTLDFGTIDMAADFNTGGTVNFYNNTQVKINGNVLTSGVVAGNSASASVLGGTGTWYVSGNLGGSQTFTPGTSTVIYNGGYQNVRGYTYYNVTFTGNGDKPLQSALTVTGTLTVNTNSGNAFGENSQAVTINQIRLKSGIYYDENGTNSVGWLIVEGGTFTGANNNSTNNYTRVSLVSGTLNLRQCNWNIGDITVHGGTLTDDNNVGNLIVADSIKYLGGIYNAASTTTSANVVLVSGGTVNANSGTHSYKELKINSGTYDLQNTVTTVDGPVTVAGGATLTHGSNNFTVNGNFINGGTYSGNGGTLVMANGATPIDASITGTVNPYSFTVNKPGKTVTTAGSMTLNSGGGTFTLTAGTLTLGGNLTAGANTAQMPGGTINIGSFTLTTTGVVGSAGLTINAGSGTWNISGSAGFTGGGTLNAGTSTINYTCNCDQPILGLAYYNLGALVGGTKTLQSNLSVNTMTVSGNAYFRENDKTINITTLNITGGNYEDWNGPSTVGTINVSGGVYNGTTNGSANANAITTLNLSGTGIFNGRVNDCCGSGQSYINIGTLNQTGGNYNAGNYNVNTTIATANISGGSYNVQGDKTFIKELFLTGGAITQYDYNSRFNISKDALPQSNHGRYAHLSGRHHVVCKRLTCRRPDRYWHLDPWQAIRL